MKGSLAEYQKKFGIKRIDFGDIVPTELDEEYAEYKFICPYCHTEMEFEGEDTDQVLGGMTVECIECGKNFRVEAEVTINTTCTPLEDFVLQGWTRRHIESMYQHNDECDRLGMQWDLDNRYGVVEWEVWKEYAEPLIHNREMENDDI